jgi:hypothetical protein
MAVMSDEKLEREFKRQVYLCSGLGYERMFTILLQQFRKTKESKSAEVDQDQESALLRAGRTEGTLSIPAR